ncbi:hypothetical protein [Paraburkholderia bryophila]|uniref:DUF1311 domain-containing protein n=1 Tax=Paraburkholderia bryophila TaxID=420952 RepID=A0A7Y9WID5_9BURK|nr:hypothetical protein [Paraburkholderia bryophila]NYH21417.1 hypothetical protein [Paraburkholderia bryophila]
MRTRSPACVNGRLRCVVVLAAAFVSLGAQAAEDRVILAQKAKINEACTTLGSQGLTCKFIKASDIDGAAGDARLWVPSSSGDLGAMMQLPADRTTWLERGAGTEFFAQALIYQRTDRLGIPYFSARMAVLSRVGSNAPRYVDDKDDLAWATFDSRLKSAPEGSEDATSYLTSVDVAAASEAAAIGDAKSKAAADVIYRQSPEFRHATLRANALVCVQLIAGAKLDLERDSRMAAISGYEDVAVRQSAAATIVRCQDVIRSAQHENLKK